MQNIICIGEALIDMICTDKGETLSNGENFLKKAGGAPTNVAAAIAALGGKVSLAAKVGKDPFGQHLIEVLENFGVEGGWIFKDEHIFTTFAFVSLLKNGERDFYFNRGADGHLSIKEIENIDLSQFDIIHFGSATAFLEGDLQAAYSYFLEKAGEQKKFISFDPNYRHLLYKDLQPSFIAQSIYFIERCHFFKMSDEEAMLITGSHSLESAVQQLMKITQAIFVITLGEKGALLRVEDTIKLIPAVPVQAVDTTGAGDAFVGAVLYLLSLYAPTEISTLSFEAWEKIVQQANKAGAKTCMYMGAMEAFKHLNTKILA